MRRALLATVLVLGLAAAPGADAAPRPTPLVDLPPLGGRLHDRVLARGAPALRPVAHAAGRGATVGVMLSPAFAPAPGVAQSYVNFLGSLPHGAELSDLTIYIAPASEVVRRCRGSESTLACYEVATHTMVVPGDEPPASAGITRAYILAHEYGHHVAAERSNPPWDALAYGPKRWASHEHVCARAMASRVAPGDEGAGYASNPGEAWADTYARLRYPAMPWTLSPVLSPDAGALRAARADVLRPWLGPARRVLRGSGAGQLRLALRLDGPLRARLRAPAGGRVALRVDGRVVARSRAGRLAVGAVCRTHARGVVTLRVRAHGPFRLSVRYAG